MCTVLITRGINVPNSGAGRKEVEMDGCYFWEIKSEEMNLQVGEMSVGLLVKKGNWKRLYGVHNTCVCASVCVCAGRVSEGMTNCIRFKELLLPPASFPLKVTVSQGAFLRHPWCLPVKVGHHHFCWTFSAAPILFLVFKCKTAFTYIYTWLGKIRSICGRWIRCHLSKIQFLPETCNVWKHLNIGSNVSTLIGCGYV